MQGVVAYGADDPRTLTVVSVAGATWPGTLTTNYGSSVSQYVTGTVVNVGATQYVCSGVSVTGNTYTLVNPTNVVLTLTNNATLVWNWQRFAPTILTATQLPSGTIGSPCMRVLAASGGTQPYAWSLVSGTLPPGLSLASTGVISGTATAKTNASFTLQVTGFDGLHSNRVFSLAINAAASDSWYNWSNLAGLPGIVGNANGTGTVARFYNPNGVTVDTNGNLLVTDTLNHTLRKVTTVGAVTTLAGSPGANGIDDGTGSTARFNRPVGLAVDTNGNVFVVDSYNYTIRKVVPSGTSWVVSTVAGSALAVGNANGTGSVARFNFPSGLSMDGNGNIYVADQYNQTIRRCTPVGANLAVTTLAGTVGIYGSTDGTGSVARFWFPADVAVDANTNLFVADQSNHTIRKATPSGANWVVTTLTGSAGASGSSDGTNGVARFNTPSGVAMDVNGALFVTDSGNHTIRKIMPSGTNWIVTTVGGLAGFAGTADGTGSVARFCQSAGIVVATDGVLYVADRGNHRISRGVPRPIPLISSATPLPAGVAGVCYTQTLIADNGCEPYTWAVTSGCLPLGLHLSSDGVISGVPDSAGSASFLVQASGTNGLFSTKSFDLVIVKPCVLTVANARGDASPDNGPNPYATGSVVSASVPDTVLNGATQYLCMGASVVSNQFTLVNPTNVTLTLTNSATLTWSWATNYWLHVDSGPNGSAAPSDVWEGAGSNVQVTAMPAAYYDVAGWSGQTNGATIDSNQISFAMDAPRALQVQFAALLATNDVPQWWLAQHGQTNGSFDAAALLDPDGDGMPNWAEYTAGTDPTNAVSVLHIAGFTPCAVAFTPAFTSRNYAVLWATNLINTGWLPLATYQPGTGTVTTLAATNVTSWMFYRIGVQLP